VQLHFYIQPDDLAIFLEGETVKAYVKEVKEPYMLHVSIEVDKQIVTYSSAKGVYFIEKTNGKGVYNR
jgi:hypothetical protein